MKLGIFGDSFAIGSRETLDSHWYTVLGKLMNAEVKSYGLGGTSLFYSYKKLFEHHKKYDLNIFLVTHFERYTKPFYFSFKSGEEQWASSINHVQNLRTAHRNQLSEFEIGHLIRLENWFTVSDDEFMKASQEALIRHMKSEISNVIFVPCFHENFSMSDKMKSEFNIGEKSSCWDYLIAQRKFFGITDKTQGLFYEKQNVMSCHFTPDTNKIYAEHLFEFIKNGKQLEAPEIVDHKQPRDYYYYTS